MKVLDSLLRHLPGGHLSKGLLASTAVYGVYLIYVAANYALLANDNHDPFFQLTGVRRIEQVLSISALFGITVAASLMWHLARDGRSLNFASNTAEKHGFVLLVALIFLNAAAASLGAVLNELNSQFWAHLFAWNAAVLATQVLVVYAALSWVRRPWINLLLMAELSFVNLFALYMSLVASYQGQPFLVRMAIITSVALGFAALFMTVGKRVVPLRNVNALLTLTMIAPVLGIILAPSGVPATGNRLAPFANVDFRAKPDIHIVSIDALSPVSLTKKHMDLSDLPYMRLLETDGVVVFKNAFASQVPTTPSLNSLMSFAHPDFAGYLGYFAGHADSPVAHILHANGYKVSTGFDRAYFGNKGPFVDSYLPEVHQSARNSTLCSLVSDHPLKFFGFCSLAELITDTGPAVAWPDRVIDIIRQSVGASVTPEFTLHYIFDPVAHAGGDYRSSDREARKRYAAFYRKGAAEIAEIMRRLARTVRGSPKPSILLVMGDHGPYLSFTANYDDDPTFMVQDRHGILAAVLVNKTDCTEQQLRHYSPTYATPERILAGVIRCLARDPARVDAALKFNEAYNFKSFFYE